MLYNFVNYLVHVLRNAELNHSVLSDLLSSVAQVIRQVLGGQQDEDAGLEEDGSGSGDEMEAAPSFSVDIQEDSFLDLVFNIIPDTIDSITGGNTEVGTQQLNCE